MFTPIPVNPLFLKGLKSIKKVSTTRSVTHILCDDGVYAFGVNYQSKLGLSHPRDVIAQPMKLPFLKGTVRKTIRAPDADVVFFIARDAIFVCGPNSNKMLGLPDYPIIDSPTKLPFSIGKACSDIISADISIAYRRTYFLCEDGVYASGTNEFAELGLAHNKEVAAPEKITALDGKRIRSVRSLDSDTAAYFISEENSVYVCGHNKMMNLGLEHNKNINVPTEIVSLTGKVLDIYYFQDTVNFICTDGIYSCGYNFINLIFDESGRKLIESGFFMLKKSVNVEITKIIKIAPIWSSYFLLTNNNVFVMGHNRCGHLGKDEKCSNEFKEITSLKDKAVLDVTIGSDATGSRLAYFTCKEGIYKCVWNASKKVLSENTILSQFFNPYISHIKKELTLHEEEQERLDI